MEKSILIMILKKKKKKKCFSSNYLVLCQSLDKQDTWVITNRKLSVVPLISL